MMPQRADARGRPGERAPGAFRAAGPTVNIGVLVNRDSLRRRSGLPRGRGATRPARSRPQHRQALRRPLLQRARGRPRTVPGAVGRARPRRLHRGERPGTVRRRRRGSRGAHRRVRGDRRGGCAPAPAAGVERDLDGGARPVRLERSALHLAAPPRRGGEDGLRRHRARGRVEHPPAHHQRDAGHRGRLGAARHEVLHLGGRAGPAPAAASPAPAATRPPGGGDCRSSWCRRTPPGSPALPWRWT